MKNISIEEYIVSSANPSDVMAILSKYKVPKAKNWDDLIKKIRYVMLTNKNVLLDELKAIDTPYKQLILHGTEEKSNACGCSGFAGGCQCQKCLSSNEKSSSLGVMPVNEKEASAELIAETKTDIGEREKMITNYNKYAPVAVTFLLAGILIAVMAKN